MHCRRFANSFGSLWPGAALASLVACERISAPPSEVLAPAIVLSAEADSTWSMVGRFALVGCAIAAVDPVAGALRILDSGSTRWRTIAGPGDGPGELRNPRALAAGGDSVLAVMDWVRRRLILYRLSGRLVADVTLQGGVSQHAEIGRIAVARDGRIIDFWLARPLGYAIPKGLLDSIPLVAVLDRSGMPESGGWGAPRIPSQPDAVILRSVLQMGDLALRGDSLFVLRSIDGVVEAYSLREQARSPVRSVVLRRYRRAPVPRELAPPRVGPNGELSRGRVEAEAVALAMAVDSSGRFYVVSPLNDRVDGNNPWPSEVLTVYDPSGTPLLAYRLSGRNTLQIGVAPDGSLVISGQSGGDLHSSQALQIFRPLFPQPRVECRWMSAHGRPTGR